MVEIRWAWLFLHHEEGDGADAAWDFWRTVTSSELSPRRGDRGQFATLLPADGDGWVKLQRTLEGDGIHLDLSVEDVDAAAREAERLGGVMIASYTGVRVLRSPGGFVFCLTDWAAEGGPSRQVRQGATVLDQACLDIPSGRFEDELAFWSALTGWQVRGSDHPEFRSLRRPDGVPVRVLLQRLGDETGVVRGHPDVACADRARAVADWVAAGAEVVEEHDWWTVVRDPAGLVCCLTDRDPATGLAATRHG